MTDNFLTRASRGDVLRAGLSTLFILLLTSVHHVYGAAFYDTPWRLHIVYISIPAALVIAGALYLGRHQSETGIGSVAPWIALVLMAGFAIVLIGFYEGGYNHVLKNVLYFAGARELAAWLFPAGMYELPNDFIFEATGVAQFMASLWAARFTWRLVRGPRATTNSTSHLLVHHES